MREYVVTCKTKEDLESFYEDMETPGGNLYIPEREVTVANKRLVSRNTHYMLTDEEANTLKDDPRVLAVELTEAEQGIVIRPLYTIEQTNVIDEYSDSPNYTETSNRWSKTTNVSDTFRNWGLPRCLNGETPDTNWGGETGATPNITSNNTNWTIRVTSSGQNVDVVIVDGCIDPSHPEFQKSADGTGGTRVNQFNWLSLRSEVEGTSNGNYVYTPYIDSGNTERTADNNHGCHVAGIAAGNRQGWARDANIFNINLYSTAPTNLGSGLVFDYIRAWHNSKSANASTGKKNPTICNNSWGSSYAIPIDDIASLNWRGTTITKPGGGWSQAQLEDYGLMGYFIDVNDNNIAKMAFPALTAALQADLDDCIADGIIMVAAAGNDSFKSSNSEDVDYNNYLVYFGTNYYYHRGSQPAALTNMISVGNASEISDDQKAASSTCGSRIDVYAPGSRIMGPVHNATVSGGGNVTSSSDSRNSNYRNAKYSGTSMAAPQVTGSLACLLEIWPRMTPQEAIDWVANEGRKVGQMNPGRASVAYTVTNNGSSSYSFSGGATGSNPTINIQEGDQMTFNMNAPGHPFKLVTSNPSTTGGYTGTDDVTQGEIIVQGSEDTGTIFWDTRGVTPGTYYYVCEFHQLMYGAIVVTNDYDRFESLQSDNNFYYNHPNQRLVPDPAGSSNYIGGTSSTSITVPRGKHKSRPASGSVWPRRDTWHRG